MNYFACSFVILLSAADPGHFQFRHHFVDNALPGSGWGQTALDDIDRDGDLDFITGQSGRDIRWYEFTKGKDWEMHLIGKNSPSEVGAVTLDVDRDGKVDFVTGGAWYRQPEQPKAGVWPRFVFDENLKAVHDVLAADLDGDGWKEIITMSDRNDVRYYTIPPQNPTGAWTMSKIGPSVHAGISAEDLDGDGDIDIVRSQIWFENIEQGKEWKEHTFCGIPWSDRDPGTFLYLATKSQVADINGDGRNDIVLTEAEFAGARVAWFEAPENPKDLPWKHHILPHSDQEKRGPYHSLQVADFDLDGDMDIFSGEMERFGIPPHRWFLWENRAGVFYEHVILDKRLGTHDTVAGDIDGDGDIDLVGKLWMAVGENGNEGRNHVDYLENLATPTDRNGRILR